MKIGVFALAFVVIFGILRIIFMDHVNKYTKPYKSRRATKARFELYDNETSGKAVTVTARGDGCVVCISHISKDGEAEYKKINEGSDLLDKLEYIADKYDLSEIGTLSLADVPGNRAFSIDYGINTRYFISRNQELPDKMEEMLDEIESVLKEYY